MSLDAQPLAVDPPFVTLTLTITNNRRDVANVSSSQIGFALLSEQTTNDYKPFTVSDGPSTAIITRTDVLQPHWEGKLRIGDSTVSYSYSIADEDRLPDSFTLPPHGSKTTKITFMLPRGSYQFLAGYGGGVHEEYLVVSNPVSVDLAQ
jgi:hypothetical protein